MTQIIVTPADSMQQEIEETLAVLRRVMHEGPLSHRVTEKPRNRRQILKHCALVALHSGDLNRVRFLTGSKAATKRGLLAAISRTWQI